MTKHTRNITLLTGTSSLILMGSLYSSFHEYTNPSILHTTTGGSNGGSAGGSGGPSIGGSGGQP